MFRFSLLLSCLALCHSHAVLPLVVPAAHSVHVPLVAPYAHGYVGYGHSLWGHGFYAKPLGHHILKRSPHIVAPFAHGHLGHVAPIAHVAPVAVSHQSRLDVRTAPVIAPVPVVKEIITPVVAASVLQKPLLGAYGHGLGHQAGYGHYAGGLGHYGYPLGHY